MFEPLNTPVAIAIFFTIWWISLFMVLPFGIKSQHESGGIERGTDPGAPVVTGLLWKALWTTLIACAAVRLPDRLHAATFHEAAANSPH